MNKRHSEDQTLLPPLNLLDKPKPSQGKYSEAALEAMSRQVELKLQDFNIQVEVVAVNPGPVITRFELEPAPGVKVSQINNLAKDLARSLSVVSVRVVDVIPGKSVIGLEIPNSSRELVSLSEILGSREYEELHSAMALGLGKDISGRPVVMDLSRMPHLLAAGATGSGKSVAINAMILSLLYKSPPRKVRMIMIDPVMISGLSVYGGIPHLLTPVISDMKEAANALRWGVAEMERRYRLMAALGVRNIDHFNRKVNEDGAPASQELPFIVILIDELANMMMTVGKKTEELIARLAQKAQAAGIHLILATQFPFANVITGLIKANIPCRIAFQVSSKADSRTILEQTGAENLLGHGDMLLLPPGTGVPIRVHGAFVDDHEVHKVVENIESRGGPDYLEDVTLVLGEGGAAPFPGVGTATDDIDPLYDEAVRIVTEHRRTSISYIRRRLRIGYYRAAWIVEEMEASGLVGPAKANGNRKVLTRPPPPADRRTNVSDKPREPDISTYVPGALSPRGAAICWLISWLIKWACHDEPGHERLRECGRKFLETLFKKHGKEIPENLGNVEIWQPDENIDVLARIGEYVLLIENRTDTKDHISQLGRHYDSVRKGETQAGRLGDNDKILPIYLNTGNQSFRERIYIENEAASGSDEVIPYKFFDRSDFLEVIKDYRSAHPILADLADRLEHWDKNTQRFEQWEEGGKYRWSSCQGFFQALEDHLVLINKDVEVGFGNNYVLRDVMIDWLVLNKDVRVGFGNNDSSKSSPLEWNPDCWGWNWSWVPGRAGGFAGFWWWWKKIELSDKKSGLYLLLQISLDDPDTRKLYFKVDPMIPDDDLGKEVRDYCTTHILEAGGDLVCEPNRTGAGSSTTIAQWNEGEKPWLVFDPGGGVNMKKTVKNLIKAQRILDKTARAIRKERAANDRDPLYDEAVRIVTETGKIDISYIQRRLKIGYYRAARVVEEMAANGLVGPLEGDGNREILAGPPPPMDGRTNVSEKPKEPDIFTYATEELSQDAVICWLIEWAYHDEPGHEHLRACGRKFLNALFKKHGKEIPENVSNVEIWQENWQINVLARIGQYVLLITDLGYSRTLNFYYKLVREGKTQAGPVDNDKILPIYLNTGNQSLRERIEIENETKSKSGEVTPFKVFDRSDFLRVIKDYRSAHMVLAIFADLLEHRDEHVTL